MTAKKKTNYISYEIKKLEKYVKQLQQYLDDNPPDEMTDRKEKLIMGNGGEVLKVIASVETQVREWRANLKELPGILLQLNALRKEVDGEAAAIEVRGGSNLPGFMEDDKEQAVDLEQDDFADVKKPEVFDDDDDNPINQPLSTVEDLVDDDEDMDSYYDD